MNRCFFDSKEVVLQNGLKVVTIKKDTQIASVQLGVKVGALYEKQNEKGISHFIEHMLFKGTTHRDNETLNRDLENLGGEYNAYTDYGCTVYSITALEDELESSIELLSDMIMFSNFPDHEIERERGVILSEIRTSKDDIEDYSFKKVCEAGFSKSPLKYEVVGCEDSVNSFSKKELSDFYKKYYVPNNSCITVVSSLEHEDALSLIEKYFQCWVKFELEKSEIIIENNIKTKNISYKNDIEQSTIIFLYTFYDMEKEKELPLKILNHRLGESANSILFRELREKKGLAYDVYTHIDMTNYVKTLFIYTAVAEDKVDEAVTTIEQCIDKIINKEIIFNDETLALMKKVHKTAVVSTLEDSADLGNYVLHQCMDDEDIYEFIKDMDDLEKIKKDDIYEVALDVLKNPTIHILMPLK